MLKLLLFFSAPFIGGLVQGLERIIRARMQRRVGPPLLQPFYDMCKLADKRISIVHPLHALFAVMHFVTMWAVVWMIIYGQNLLYIIFMHLFATSFLVIAGYSVKSIYSHIGANRELLVLFVYEPILILFALALYMMEGSFIISEMEFLNSSFALLPFFVSLIIVTLLKLSKSPFDIAHAHQEIVAGVEVEYGGLFYEFLYTAKWLEYFFIGALFWLLCGANIWLFLPLVFALVLAINLIDNATARLQMKKVLQVGIGLGLGLAILNIIGLYYV